MIIDFQKIKSDLDLRIIVKEYGYTPDRKGFICCPFHLEKTPSMKIEKEFFYCFGCHVNGDVFDFIGRINGLTFQQTLTKMNEDYKLGFGEYIDGEARKQIRVEYRMRNADREIKSRNKKRYIEAYNQYAEEHRVLFGKVVSGEINPENVMERLRFINTLLDAGLEGNEGIVLFFQSLENAGVLGQDYCREHGVELNDFLLRELERKTNEHQKSEGTGGINAGRTG